MNLITRTAQKTVIHLSRVGDAVFARVLQLTLQFDGSYNTHVVGVERLTDAQVADLSAKAEALQAYNIFVVDATTIHEAALALPFSIFSLAGTCSTVETPISSDLLVSPYFSKIQLKEAFISSQLTRGPNSY